MSKHTPGPWKANKFADTKGWTLYAAGIGKSLASIRHIGDETAANAKLIAAAPDLLAACEALLLGVDDYWASTEEGIATIGDARAAIQKATEQA